MHHYESLYIHVPFCRNKCDYCSFYSVPLNDAAIADEYLARLRCELVAHLERCLEMRSVFVGGGTPSVLSEEALEALLAEGCGQLPLAEDCEFTVECNPESLTAAKLAVMTDAGVNRLSLGVQSFDPSLRETIGRRTPDGAIESALSVIQASSVDNWNIDLIYGIPGQTLDHWTRDLVRACEAGASHLSTYSLTVEEGSALARRDTPIPGDELTVAMWKHAATAAAEYGLERYEVSNLARPGTECRHNLELWHGGTYLGLGPAAASFDGVERRSNPADLNAWLRGDAPEIDRLTPEKRAAEILAFGLRTVEGWPRHLFRQRTGVGMEELRGAVLHSLEAGGFLQIDSTCIRPAEHGLLFADHVAAALL